MDPITILLSALSLAGTAAKPVTDQAIKDGYAGLKALILRKFGSTHPKVESTLADYADDPETYQKPVTNVLTDAGVDHDPEVLEEARKLVEQARQLPPGSLTVTASGERSVAIGGSMSGGTISTGDQLMPPSASR